MFAMGRYRINMQFTKAAIMAISVVKLIITFCFTWFWTEICIRIKYNHRKTLCAMWSALLAMSTSAGVNGQPSEIFEIPYGDRTFVSMHQSKVKIRIIFCDNTVRICAWIFYFFNKHIFQLARYTFRISFCWSNCPRLRSGYELRVFRDNN